MKLCRRIPLLVYLLLPVMLVLGAAAALNIAALDDLSRKQRVIQSAQMEALGGVDDVVKLSQGMVAINGHVIGLVEDSALDVLGSEALALRRAEVTRELRDMRRLLDFSAAADYPPEIAGRFAEERAHFEAYRGFVMSTLDAEPD